MNKNQIRAFLLSHVEDPDFHRIPLPRWQSHLGPYALAPNPALGAPTPHPTVALAQEPTHTVFVYLSPPTLSLPFWTSPSQHWVFKIRNDQD